MHTSVYNIVLQILAVTGVTVNLNKVNDVRFNVKNELRYDFRPFEIYCGLGDIIVMSAPIVACNESYYYLTRPDGKKTKLEITRPRLDWNKDPYTNLTYFNEYSNIEVRIIHDFTVIVRKYKHTVFNVNDGATSESNDTFNDYENKLDDNDLMIGPLDESYHGNWDISVYYKNEKGDWVELSQMFSVLIMELIPLRTKGTTKAFTTIVGRDLTLQFAYPVKDINSCELHAPQSTFDRFFGRFDNDLTKCGYVVTNITKEDAGVWRIVGVGRIIYEASMYLKVKLDKSSQQRRRRTPQLLKVKKAKIAHKKNRSKKLYYR